MPSSAQGPARPPSRPPSDRYEALPSVAGLPAWIWRRLPPPGKLAVGLLPLVIIGLVLLLGPGIDRSKEERRQAEAERLARLRAERIARLRIEQRPRFGRGAAAGTDAPRRTALVREARDAVERDARRRVAAGTLSGPIRRVACEPYPRTVDGRGAHVNPDLPSGRYACLAVTRDVPPTERNEAAAIGHPYRLRVDFASGRYAFCKVAGRAGEGALGAAPVVTVPRACGGR